jgi:2-oxo-4-hydroxy-4-carboxy-5-ureidoimidazoline decarboxylase
MRAPDITAFDAMPPAEAESLLEGCLGVRRWVRQVEGGRPYATWPALRSAASEAAAELSDSELDEALAGHPRIGERPGAGHAVEHSRREQAGVDPADSEVARRLAAGNAAYEERFGRVFLLRAIGRSAEEILAELERRLRNSEDEERRETVEQLREIALLRLEGVLS